MEWKNEYSSGIVEIDNQHKQLLRLLSIVDDEVKGDHRWPRIHDSIIDVINFARFHFQFEEALMRLYGFPDYEKHCKVHQQIIVQAENLVANTLDNIPQDDVVSFFVNWQVAHTKKEDQAFARYILSGAQVVACTTLPQI